MSNGKIGPVLAKKYVLLRQDTGGPAGQQLGSQFKVGTCSVVVLNPDGEVVGKLANKPAPERVYHLVDGVPEFRAGMDELAKLKEKGITKSNATAVAAALKRIGAMPSEEARKAILEYAKDDSAVEAVQAGAIRALYRQPEVAKELVEWLTDKRTPIKEAAKSSLLALDLAALPALFDGLASSEADVRGASFVVAATITRINKLSRDATFWRNGKEEARGKALDEWRAWHKTRTEPKK